MSRLNGNSILDEIRRLHESGQSGILTLKNDNGGRVDVFVREGMIEAASSNLPGRRLGDYLSKDSGVPPGDLDAAESEARRQKISFGEAAVRRNLLSQPELVDR